MHGWWTIKPPSLWHRRGVVERAQVDDGYSGREVVAPVVARACERVRSREIGSVLTFRGLEAHGGPHGPWFWDKTLSGGGVL